MSRARLLVVDSDPAWLMLFADRLRSDGFAVTAAITGEHVIESLEEDPLDLAILGPSIAPGDDATVAGWIRSRATAPILHLRAGAPEPGRRAGRGQAVADRSVTAPFEHSDVLTAIDDLLARFADGGDREPTITLDGVAGRVRVRRRVVQLSPMEMRLVAALLAEPGVAVSTSRLLAEVWPDERQVDASSMWILVWRVRQKIELDPKHPDLLVNVPGAGYRLAVESRGTAPD